MSAEGKIDSSFKTRVKSALLLGPAVLVILFFGDGAFLLMIAAAGGIASYEWGKMVLTGQKHPPGLVHLVAGLSSIGVLSAGMVLSPATSLWLLLSLCFLAFAYNFSQHGPEIKNLLLGMIYISFSLAVLVWLRGGTSSQGLYQVTTLLLIVWGSDIFAYLAGKSIGGPKLAPAISPKKTWAGFIGSSLGAGLVAGILASPPVLHVWSVRTIADMGSTGYFILAAVLAMFGQAGDLMISIFKRHYGVKDTGTLIPGHGGILDRIDALMLVTYLFGMTVAVAG